jgi:hypothetical protein
LLLKAVVDQMQKPHQRSKKRYLHRHTLSNIEKGGLVVQITADTTAALG